MALLRRRAEAPALDENAPDESARDGGKGRPTPKRAEARTGRNITYKTPNDPKAAKSKNQLARRAQAQEYRSAMRAGDVSRMPPRERGPERTLARDFVDGRRNVGPIFLLLALFYFLSPVIGRAGYLIAAILMFTGLLAVILDSFYIGRKVSKEIVARGLDPHVKVRMYAAQRALLPRRWRMPRARNAPAPLRGRR